MSSESNLYNCELKTVQASFPRYPGSLTPGIASDALKISYRRYQPSRACPPGAAKFNLVFLHGTGMNKGIWHYHIDQLYQKCWDLGIHIGVVLAVDTINHGASAVANQGKLGKVLDWRDASYDVARIAEAELADFLSTTKNILVGHSMAGLVSLYLSYVRPSLFDACVVLNPVCYLSKQSIESPYEPFITWQQKKYMETEFEVQPHENWREKVESYMRLKSFYRYFDQRVLDYMLEDEYPKLGPETNSQGTTVQLNTTQRQTLITYYGSIESTRRIAPIFPEIQVPVYRLLSELDSSLEEHRVWLQRAIPSMKTIALPGEKHLVHGTNPDLIVDKLFGILEQRKSAPATYFLFIDPDMALKLKI